MCDWNSQWRAVEGVGEIGGGGEGVRWGFRTFYAYINANEVADNVVAAACSVTWFDDNMTMMSILISVIFIIEYLVFQIKYMTWVPFLSKTYLSLTKYATRNQVIDGACIMNEQDVFPRHLFGFFGRFIWYAIESGVSIMNLTFFFFSCSFFLLFFLFGLYPFIRKQQYIYMCDIEFSILIYDWIYFPVHYVS